MTKTVELKFSDKQYDMISRIAEEDKRRIDDLFYIFLAEGVKFFYMDNGLCIKKRPDEYSAEEIAQKAKNKELMAQEGFNHLPYEKQKAQGFDYVCKVMTAHDEGETFLDRLADDITKEAFQNV